MTAYELMVKREDLQNRLNDLSLKTNSWMGRSASIWDSMSYIQEQIKEIDSTLKSIVIR